MVQPLFLEVNPFIVRDSSESSRRWLPGLRVNDCRVAVGAKLVCRSHSLGLNLHMLDQIRKTMCQ